MIAFRVAAVTHQGLIRKYIQDYVHVSTDKQLLVVVGGLGGNPVGTEAGESAVQSIDTSWTEHRPELSDDSAIKSWLQEAIEEANAAIHKRYAADRFKGCSTIVVAVHSDKNKVHIAHVGDSRAYRLRDGELKALTDDHRVSVELIKAGKMTREQVADRHFCKDYLTRAVGFNDEIAMDKTAVSIEPGDLLLLCTDGLYVCLSEERIAEILSGCKTPQDACDQLLADTIDRGAPDNVALVVAQYL